MTFRTEKALRQAFLKFRPIIYENWPIQIPH